MKNYGFSFSKTVIANLVPQAKTYTVRDKNGPHSVRGLILDVTPKGRKIYKVVKKKYGKNYKCTLGDTDTLTLEEAREKAREFLKTIRKGQLGAPPSTHGNSKLDEVLELSITQMQKEINRREISKKYVSNCIQLHRDYITNTIGQIPIKALTRQIAIQFMDSICEQYSYAIHNSILTFIKSAINRVIGDDLPNVFNAIKKINEDQYIRQRCFSQVELHKLLDSLTHERQIYQDFVLILIFTAQRKDNVVNMKWRQIDFDNKVWILSSGETKNLKNHGVPLTDQSLSVLKRRFESRAQNETFVFPSAQSKTGHIAVKGGEGSFWRRILVRAGLYVPGEKNLCMHDLRRTTASAMLNDGVPLIAISKILAHSDISITSKVYAHLETNTVGLALQSTTERLLSKPESAIENHDKFQQQMLTYFGSLNTQKKRDLLGKLLEQMGKD